MHPNAAALSSLPLPLPLPEPEPERNARLLSGEKKYKGVRRRKWGRWVSEICLPNSRERIWLGSYDTPEKAARAFDAAYLCLRGTGGDGLNFPDSPPPDVGRTSHPQEVYAAAVSHANRAAAAAPPCAAAEPSEPTQAHAGELVLEAAVVPAPSSPPLLKVSAERFDWWQVVANPPPIYSPTMVGRAAMRACRC